MEERKDAAHERRKIAGRSRPVIVWSLGGSSVHKLWPYTAKVLRWLFDETDCKVVTVGSQLEQVIEFSIAQQFAKEHLKISYEDSHELGLGALLVRLKDFWGENKMICRSGSWTIRQSLAFLEQASMVVGPETGVLNAAAMMEMPKIIMLSHSSHTNLTRDWNNAHVVPSHGCSESPCHRLHNGFEFCYKDEQTGAAMCSAAVKPEVIFGMIMQQLSGAA